MMRLMLVPYVSNWELLNVLGWLSCRIDIDGNAHQAAAHVFRRRTIRLAVIVIGLGNLVNIFNPQVLVLSGGLSRDPEIPKYALVSYKNTCMGLSSRTAKIVKSRFREQMGILGAAAWAMENLKITV